jgi:hypothetical protein
VAKGTGIPALQGLMAQLAHQQWRHKGVRDAPALIGKGGCNGCR